MRGMPVYCLSENGNEKVTAFACYIRKEGFDRRKGATR